MVKYSVNPGQCKRVSLAADYGRQNRLVTQGGLKQMKRLAMFMLLMLAFFMAGCGKKVDVVAGISPVSDAFTDTQATLDELAKLPAHRRADYLHARHPDLGQRLAYYLRQRGKIRNNQEIQAVDFHFGSLSKVKAEDASGRVVEGFFKNQLLARVRISGQSKPLAVIVRCLNGIFELPEDLGKAGMEYLGAQVFQERFTIGKGDSLVRHVGYRLAIDLAERHGLPLTRGKGSERAPITPEMARRLETETDRVQVAAMVFEGDRFDLAAGTYVPAPKAQPKQPRKARKR